MDAGNFTATYDTSAFLSGWSVPVDGYLLQPSQYQVSTGLNSLRIDIVQLPSGAPNPSSHQGPETLLSVVGTPSYAGSLSVNLPLTLTADAPGTKGYRISIGTSLSASSYDPSSNAPSNVSGTVSLKAANASVASIAVSASVPTQGITTPVKTIYSAEVGPAFDLASIVGQIRAYGTNSRIQPGTTTFGIDFIQIDAISAVPESGTFALMGLGLVGIVLARMRHKHH